MTETGEEKEVGERTLTRAGRQPKKYYPEITKFSSVTIWRKEETVKRLYNNNGFTSG